jgi:surface antigen
MAVSLAYFTWEISAVSRQIPDILESINNTAEVVEPVVEEVGQVVELLPPVLREVEETRKLVPSILKEFEQTRQQVPAVLNEIEALRKELPEVLATTDRASAAVITVSKEVEATRPLIPLVLKEVETTRESIPGMMKEADVLIDKARAAGKEASQGAVTGLLEGIITAPFVLVGDVGRAITGVSKEEAKAFTNEDFDKVEKATLGLLANGSEGDLVVWQNPETGNHGTIEIMLSYNKGEFSEYECRTIRVKSFSKDREISNKKSSVCKDDDGKWDFDE